MPKHDPSRSRSFRSDRRGWGIFLLLLLVGAPLTWAWHHRRVLIPAPAAPSAPLPYRLAVLEYGRLLPPGKPEALSGAQLEAQLKLLRERGFTPVSASQVAAAYHQATQLPPRSILLTFDGGYLSSYEEAHPILSRLQWPALMFIETGRQEHRDPIFLYWDRLQLMLDSGVWELGTHGHRSLKADGQPLPSLPSGEASFLRSRDIMNLHLRGSRILAFAHLKNLTPALSPSLPADSLLGPQLAFRTDIFGVNDPSEPPLHLNRLKVDPAWPPEELARRLELAMSEPGGPSTLDRWIPDQQPGMNRVRREPGGILLEGTRRNDVWLAGSRWAQAWVLQTRFRVEAGEFWIAQEFEYGGRHWRFGGKQSTLYFQDRTPGSPPLTLARIPQEKPLYGWHDLRITRRGPGVWVEMDGRALSEFPFLLSDRRHGNIGILSGPDEGGFARLEITEARFTPLSYTIQSIGPDPTPSEIQALTGRVVEIAALSPRWIQRGQGVQKELPLNQDLLRMLQGRFALDLLPEVKLLDGGTPSDSDWLLELAQRAVTAGWNGLRLDLSAVSTQDQAQWRSIAGRIEQSLKTDGIHLVVETGAAPQGEAR